MVILKSKCQSLNISVRVDGVVVRVQFTPNGYPYMFGYYYCRDNKVLEAIKNTPEFKNGIIYTDQTIAPSEKENKTETNSPKVYDAEFPGIKRTQEAKKILVEKYNVDAESILKKEDALKAAEKLNISFPDLK